jgi:fatty acid amide hydrolase
MCGSSPRHESEAMSSTTSTDTLTRLSAIELAARIARGELSAVEAVEAHIARIEQVNPALNAVVVKRYEQARAEARAADEHQAAGEPLGPLHGVPITIKESLDLAGTASTFGLPSRRDALAAEDDVYVARMRAAGAIILGKTNVAQALLYNESDNPLYGRTNNPWNVTRTPGGSSGGQAAIIAAGGSPLGLATDIAGSIRTPATFCGIAGMKSTAGRTPDPGLYSLHIGQRAISSQVGALARDVDDVALAVEIINGGRSPAVEPPMLLGDYRAVDISQLRVAYYTDDGTFAVAPAVRRAVVEAAGMLAGRGAQVTEWRPPDVARAVDIFFGLFSADGGRGLMRTLKHDKKDPQLAQLARVAGAPRPVLAVLRALLSVAGQRTAADMLRAFGHRGTLHYWDLVQAQMDYQRTFATALDADEGGPFDVIVCPAYALPALAHGATKNLVIAGGYVVVYNLLGYPTGIVPVTRVQPGEERIRKRSRDAAERVARSTERDSAGLPISVQVVARPWREHVALAAMCAIQGAARSQADYPALAPV